MCQPGMYKCKKIADIAENKNNILNNPIPHFIELDILI